MRGPFQEGSLSPLLGYADPFLEGAAVLPMTPILLAPSWKELLTQ